ncbi:MAG: SUMF1/EgtB/PvdO family nonheme iron enzyme [Chloroflexi bacterium]|nr:SUMF1/EgtB/PvdO family nonheme iron enzyme [Chloroflexota bacterium]
MQNKAVFKMFYSSPASILRVYQRLLHLVGKDQNTAFPEGTWQFYIDYALRDDTARHACETNGFDTRLNLHNIQLSRTDRLTAWVMTAVYCLHQYPDLIANEWRERVHTHTLWQITQDVQDANLYRKWELQRPYARGYNSGKTEPYTAYRHRAFNAFIIRRLSQLPIETRRKWRDAIQKAEATQLPAYQHQMSILAYLNPGIHGETRTAIPLEQTHIGLIIDGRYHLLPTCQPNTRRPIDAHTIRNQIAALLATSTNTPPARLKAIASVKRSELATLWPTFTPELQQSLVQLRTAPIWINGDPINNTLPLARLRQTERGIGDHPLTIFDTGKTAVFDLSHIFFDGSSGAALAEILTNEALSWAQYLNQLPQPTTAEARPKAILIPFSQTDRQQIKKAKRVAIEAPAETDIVDLDAILTLRAHFKLRKELKTVTVNDLLLLYRAIHAIAYRPAPAMVRLLTSMQAQASSRDAATTALKAIGTVYTSNPAILIPVDASRSNPRDRVAPMTFEVPMTHLDMINRHQQTLAALSVYERSARNRKVAYAHFNKLQHDYLTMLASLGRVLKSLKEKALIGESLSIESIKLIANLPTPLQRQLDKIPSYFDEINDVIKGREVFSNVGVVAPNSSLIRFITAKDDNEKKELVWGAITDTNGILRVTLRDFRPHVRQLTAVRRHDVAVLITNDLLNSYATGLNQFVRDLLRIMSAVKAYPTPSIVKEKHETRPITALQKRRQLMLPPLPATETSPTPIPPPVPTPISQKNKRDKRLILPIASIFIVMLFLGTWIVRSSADEEATPIANNATLSAGLPLPTNIMTRTLPPPPTPILPTNTPGTLILAAETAVPQPTPLPSATPLHSPTPIPLPTATPFIIIQREQDQMPMVLLPETTFLMGATDEDSEAELDERPLHPIHLHSFYIDQYEVTVAQYTTFINELGSYVNTCLGFTCLSTKAETNESHLIGILNGGYVAESGYETLPINHVSWYGAAAYCDWMGARLPTEAEWEYAARGGNGRLYPWGNTPPDNTLAIFGQANSNALQPVNAIQAGVTDHGIYGMAGSVWEWVADSYDTFYYQYSPTENPHSQNVDNFAAHVLRGGSFRSPASNIRASNRHQLRATEFLGTADVGFRCAISNN